MKLLLDSCVSGRAKADLEAAGHDVVWTGDRPQDPGDEQILSSAHREQRVLVTLDNDFGELAVRRGLPHCGILRLVDIASARQGAVCNHVLSQYGNVLAGGAIITVEAGRVRIRVNPLP